MSKTSLIFRQPGTKPDISAWAQGLFRHGYLNEFLSPKDFTENSPMADLVTVAGGQTRFGGKNGEIIRSYGEAGVPGFIIEFGRMVPGTVMTLLNTKPWLPPGPLPSVRAIRFDLVIDPKPRGEDILVLGQRPALDKVLDEAVTRLKDATGRRVIWRSHPNCWRLGLEPWQPTATDEVSARVTDDPGLGQKTKTDLQTDLDRAWITVTHSSLASLEGLLRGIPAVTHEEFVLSGVCTPLDRLEELHPFDEDATQEALNQFAWTIWSDEECREGEAFEFLGSYI